MNYLISRILQGFFSLFGVASLVFFMFTILPGDPAEMMLDKNQTSEQIEILKNKYGFNLPLLDQYFFYLNDLSPLSFHSNIKNEFSYYNKELYGGISLFEFLEKGYCFKISISKDILSKKESKFLQFLCETLPNTAILAISSIMIAIFGGFFWNYCYFIQRSLD